jgi:hypothetical protein
MKMLPFTVIFLLFSLMSFEQDTVVVVEKSLKVAGMSPVTEYYGFAEGDKVIFNLFLEKGELKDVTISEYPNNVKFAEHTIERLDKKVIVIPRTGVYKFDYYNSYILPRTINIKIQRIPGDKTTKSFNTNVRWVDKVDTTYPAQQETYALDADTTFEEVINTKVKINAPVITNNLNRTTLDFVLPASTLKWVYWIGTGDESEKAFENDRKKFADGGTKLQGTVNPLAGLALGLTTMTHLTEGTNIHYYFISTGEETQKFTNSVSFKCFKQGEAAADFGLMNYANKNPQKYYLALRNDNATQNVEVSVKILAIVVSSKYKAVTERVPTYITHKIPVNEQ